MLSDCRRMMTSRKVTCQSTRGLPLPLIFPKWIPPSQRSFWSCLKREELWWFLLQCPEIQLKRRRRRSLACGRVASSMETSMFRGSESLNMLIYLSIKTFFFLLTKSGWNTLPSQAVTPVLFGTGLFTAQSMNSADTSHGTSQCTSAPLFNCSVLNINQSDSNSLLETHLVKCFEIFWCTQ